MTRLFIASVAAAVLAAPGLLVAKGATASITISGANLPRGIIIADPAALKPFQVWAGTGVTINGVPQERGFIVDWQQGPVPAPPPTLHRYQVRFYDRPNPDSARERYVVTYSYNAEQQQGYVYLPGIGDAGYEDNVRSIRRGVEGNWFVATTEWNRFAVHVLAHHR